MKYFSCQPDSHNGFGLLIGHTLTYFTMECDSQKPVCGSSSNNNSNNNNDNNNNNNNINNNSGRGNNNYERASHANECVSSCVCVQYSVALPQDFGTAPHCFSMANRSLYGFDMALVGANTGVLAVVVMSTSSVVYAPGRTLAALRTLPTAAAARIQHESRATPQLEPQSFGGTLGASSSSSSAAALATSPPGLLRSADRGVGTITWMRDKPLVFVGFMSGWVEWYHVTISASRPPPPTTHPGKVHADNTTAAANTTSTTATTTAIATPTTVGPTTTTPTTRTTIVEDPLSPFPQAKGSSEGGQRKGEACTRTGDMRNASTCRAFPPSIWTHNGSQQQQHTAQKIFENGEGDEISIRLHLSCDLHETGAFLTSDWFPANGYVVAGAERAVYVFSAEQAGVPLYTFSQVGCSFLACHPFLPIVGCLAFGRTAESGIRPDVCVLHVLEWTSSGALLPAAEKRSFHKVSRHDVYYSCSWKFSSDLQIAICNIVEGSVHVLHLSRVTTEEVEEEEGREEVVVGGEGCEPVPKEGGVGTKFPSSSSFPLRYLYTFNREREPLLRLHSLVNIEFISAATHALPDLMPSRSLLSSPSRSGDGVSLREDILAKRILHSSRPQSKTRPSHGSKRTSRRIRKQHGTRSISRGNQPPPQQQYDRDCGDDEGGDADLYDNARNAPGVKSGVGAFSRIAGVNYAGEITSIPVDTDATVAILGPGHFAVGFSGSVFLASDTSAVLNMGQRMKMRLAAGFGITAAANRRALRELNDPSDSDLHLLFAYIDIMETVGVVESVGPVPSIVELLSLTNAPSTTQLIGHKLLPKDITVVCGSTTSPNDSRRLLLLYLLNWIPSEELFQHCEGNESRTYPTCEEVERAVAVEVLHNQRPRGIKLLQQYHKLNPTYTTIAEFLKHPNVTFHSLRSGVAEVQECFLNQLSPWLQVVFLYDIDQRKIYTNTALPLWDRIAISVILENDTSRLISILHSTFAQECNILQQFLLLEGISEKTCSLMQMFVDCTGDFQLAACLFTRVGACKASSASASVSVSSSASFSPMPCTPLEDRGMEVDAVNRMRPVHSVQHPWELWADAYRTFLNNEQEFVKRTMFDLACQKLRGAHTSQFSLPATYRQKQQHKQQDHRAKQSELQFHARDVLKTITTSNTFSSAGAQETNRDTQQMQSHHLLPHPFFAMKHRHCSVCSSLVYFQWECTQDSFAWCTACLHGGHASHLQNWFRTHHKCPVFGCSCNCEHVGGTI